jgi:hypothetical protein
MRGVNDMKLNIIAERHEQHGDDPHSSRRDAPGEIARVVDRPSPLAVGALQNLKRFRHCMCVPKHRRQ